MCWNRHGPMDKCDVPLPQALPCALKDTSHRPDVPSHKLSVASSIGSCTASSPLAGGHISHTLLCAGVRAPCRNSRLSASDSRDACRAS